MKLRSLKIWDNNKFKKPINISFIKNNRIKKAEQMWNTDGNYLNILSVLGKNSSGKSSLIRIIKSYFMLLDKNKNFEKEKYDQIMSSTSISFVANSHNDDYKNETIFEVYKDLPNYILEYESNGSIIRHQVSAYSTNKILVDKQSMTASVYQKSIGNHISINEKLFIDNNLVEPIFNKSLNEKWNLYDEKNQKRRNELILFIRNTANWNQEYKTWSQQIENNIDLLIGNGDFDNFMKQSLNIIKSSDPLLINFQYKHFGNNIFPIIKGNKTIKISQLSTGTRHIISILIRIFNLKRGGLFIHDEFDAYINKSLAEMILLDKFQDGKTQGIITSHTPWIFDYNFRHDSILEIFNDGTIKIISFRDEYNLRPDKKLSNFYERNWATSPDEFEC